MNSQCDQLIIDNAHVLTTSATQLRLTLRKLQTQGVEPHIWTVALQPDQTLDMAEAQFERSCPTWQSTDGGRKNTLLVLAVAPKSHKVGTYYGGAWSEALDDHWLEIQSAYIKPAFRDGNLVSGFESGAQHIGEAIQAWQQRVDETTTQTVSPVPPSVPDDPGWAIPSSIVFGLFTFVVGILWWTAPSGSTNRGNWIRWQPESVPSS
jgi:uncharacterized membrane protein YgcG